MMGLGCEYDPSKGFCGIWPLCTGPEDPFNHACYHHDLDFEAHHGGWSDKTLRQVNAEFRDRMAAVIAASPVEDRPNLEKRARFYLNRVNGIIGRLAWGGWLRWIP